MTNQTPDHRPPTLHRATPTAAQTAPLRPWVRTTILVVGFAVAMLATNSVASSLENPVASLVIGPLLAAAMMWLYVWVGIRFEKRSVAEVDPRAGVRHLQWGIAGGVTLAAVTIGLLALFGVYQITGWGSVTGALAVVGMMCAVAVAEEVFFRGVVFRLLRSRWGVIVALIVSSAIFGLLHLINPGASLNGALAVAIEAGLMLGAAYLLTGSLWLAIGLHFGWNVAIGGIFGTVVSGSDASDSLFTATTAGPDWLTGGSFGPEASIVAIVVCSVATVAFLFAAHHRSRLAR
ncbi:MULTISPECIES: CPBP family intramembrane glutamic endopeptidase [unclassified Microbacterium]|uniref:CPBP family intramembrane glutamic endopeptidase n=1 Tax=unclassified Microbacterium TaxID=2609290 RepID=UPI000EA9B5A1|nr:MULTISPECIES: type II CAAX endopeptidase family protein [unclassified Microbacterium]MBT2484330.1 CPBP family intramembrane metalloprotease [Microbacterium sp. ISL-108]RKN67247.1 CPBP family intramembrane metalloprotease [Microbacterium sp. CGR2]